jgi:TolA-binding protein
VASFIADNFASARVHIKEQPAAFHRFGARWTPTVLMLGPGGKELRRVEGFLPADELLGQLKMALAYQAVARKQWDQAAARFASVVRDHPDTEAAPEAQYWEGVARYSGTHDASHLQETARRFKQKYAGTGWAKRSSVWGG